MTAKIWRAVYFVQRGGAEGLIKIGVTRQGIESRLQTLRSELRRLAPADEALTPLLVVPGDRTTESRMHDRFAALRDHGEWFRPGPELLSFIVAARSNPGVAFDALGRDPSDVSALKEQIDRIRWVEAHCARISSAVRACGDYEALQRVASAVGYAPSPTAASPPPPRTP